MNDTHGGQYENLLQNDDVAAFCRRGAKIPATKPLGPEPANGAPKSIQCLAVSGDAKVSIVTSGLPLTIFSACPTSPLKWSDVASQVVIDCAEHSIPVELVTMPLAGFTAPVTLVGKAQLGMPVFDKLEADLAKAMLSLPAAKGFEIGSDFAGTEMTGQAHNDHFYMEGSRVRTRTNHSGGVQGGISNGEDILVRVAFKPTATILKEQPTVDTSGNDTTIAPRGRHDPCVLPRAVPIVEAMMSLVLADHFLRHRAQCGG